MAQSYLNLINWIIGRLEERAAQDGLTVSQTHQFEGHNYTFRLTALTGFFIILVAPRVGWTDNEQDLALVFSFKDLYLLGFLDGGVWRLFNDATRDGTGDHLVGARHSPIGFSGGYSGRVFDDTMLSIFTLVQSYETLVNLAHRSNREKKTALFVFIFLISEALRFLEWKNRLKTVFMNEMEEAPDTDRQFSRLFQNWETTSKRAQEGPATFQVNTADQFHNFGVLLRNISVALRV
ncbi:hypothetical protein QOZ80_5AG0408230 [Eleusine coracana subsp. coracana]|nr:hypothetical protein QOZ80_5AG0408230 [Eleusine coracana subsp. coracana]